MAIKDMKKETTKSKNQAGFWVTLLLFIIMGVLIGYIFGNSIGKSGGENSSSLLLSLALIAMFLVTWMAGTVIHELGHLVCGLATGYKFVSFRIGSLTFIKEKGRLVRKRFTIEGTGGQCILTPKSVDVPEDHPYFWYYFGGGLFNLCTVVISAVMIALFSNKYAEMIFAMFAIVSLIQALTNLIPLKISGVLNDGYNIYLLGKSPENRKLLYNNLMLNGLQHEGMRLKDMPEKLFDGADPNGELFQTAAAIVCANRKLDIHDFISAKEQYQKLYDNKGLIQVYRNECQCELLFTMIITGEPKEECEKLFDEQIKQYIKLTEKTYITRKRLMYAYYLILEQVKEKAAEEYRQAVSMKDSYPCKGEYISEMEIIDYIKQNYDQM